MPPPDLSRLMQQAVQLHQAGHLQQAEQLYRQVLAIDPRHADAHHFMGLMATQYGKPDLAIRIFKHALSINPNFPQCCYNLGMVYMGLNDDAHAIEWLKKALSMRPLYPEALFNLGLLYHNANRVDEAIALFEKVAGLMSKMPEKNPGKAALDPNDYLDGDTHITLTCQKDFARVFSALGISYKVRGEPQKSLAAFQKALQIRPDYSEARSNLLFTILFHADADHQMIAREHALWQERHAAPLAAEIVPHANDPSPDRRLRVGYVSPDFTSHPVGRFILPLLENHDREKFEVFTYSNVDFSDDFTNRIKNASNVFRSTVRFSHSDVAKMVRDDQIDILIDLTMHTDRNRLRVFARKPAPIQVTYLAYVGTTGLTAIDYRISDPYLDPRGIDESIYSEKTARLPASYWCYEPLPITADVNPLPAATHGYITFGSLNSSTKVTDAVLEVWAQVLAAVPASRLLIICPEGRHRERILAIFAAAGVIADRIEFLATVAVKEYFELYHRVDIALDPFPYGGGTTTCDALYMGVPVVSLIGSNAMSRAGVSILSNAGHPEWLADSKEKYVQIAAHLAADIPRLADLRSHLRDQMKASPLMDGPRLARDMESLYRDMWRTWSASRGSGSV